MKYALLTQGWVDHNILDFFFKPISHVFILFGLDKVTKVASYQPLKLENLITRQYINWNWVVPFSSYPPCVLNEERLQIYKEKKWLKWK